MKSQTFFTDEALVLRKSQLKDSDQLVTLFTRNHGKIALTAFGSKSLLSRRLSHLETGNVIKCSWREDGEFKTLQETELKYAHSKIKETNDKLDALYVILFIVNKLVPENEPSLLLYEHVLSTMKSLQSALFTRNDMYTFLTKILIQEGYISVEESKKTAFDAFSFTESLLGQKIDRIM